MNPPINKANGILNVTKFPQNNPIEVTYNKDTPWVKDLLVELNENATTKDPEDYLVNSDLEVVLTISKKYNAAKGDYILVTGKLNTTYFTECVKTAEEMNDHLDLEFKTCFIEDVHEAEDEYADQTEVYTDNDLYELFFYSNNHVDLKEMIHELIYLNYNQYPTKAETSLSSTDLDNNDGILH